MGKRFETLSEASLHALNNASNPEHAPVISDFIARTYKLSTPISQKTMRETLLVIAEHPNVSKHVIPAVSENFNFSNSEGQLQLVLALKRASLRHASASLIIDEIPKIFKHARTDQVKSELRQTLLHISELHAHFKSRAIAAIEKLQ